MPGTCNDCGLAFKGDVKAHADEAHPGLPRFRFRDLKGQDHIVCPSCKLDVIEGGPQHVKSSGGYNPGKSGDPVDLFTVHQMSHEGGA